MKKFQLIYHTNNFSVKTPEKDLSQNRWKTKKMIAQVVTQKAVSKDLQSKKTWVLFGLIEARKTLPIYRKSFLQKNPITFQKEKMARSSLFLHPEARNPYTGTPLGISMMIQLSLEEIDEIIQVMQILTLHSLLQEERKRWKNIEIPL